MRPGKIRTGPQIRSQRRDRVQKPSSFNTSRESYQRCAGAEFRLIAVGGGNPPLRWVPGRGA